MADDLIPGYADGREHARPQDKFRPGHGTPDGDFNDADIAAGAAAGPADLDTDSANGSGSPEIRPARHAPDEGGDAGNHGSH